MKTTKKQEAYKPAQVVRTVQKGTHVGLISFKRSGAA